MEPLSEGPDAAIGETAGTKTPDGPSIIEAAKGRDMMIETEEESEVPSAETVKAVDASENPKDTTLKITDEDAGSTQAPPSTLTPNHLGALESEGMPELEDAGSEEILGQEPPVAFPPAEGMIDLEDAGTEEILGEEPPVAFPLAKGTLDLEDMPEPEDAGPEESMEESLADVPLTGGTPAQPWVCFKAQVCQDEVQYWAAMFTWFRFMHLSWEEN